MPVETVCLLFSFLRSIKSVVYMLGKFLKCVFSIRIPLCSLFTLDPKEEKAFVKENLANSGTFHDIKRVNFSVVRILLAKNSTVARLLVEGSCFETLLACLNTPYYSTHVTKKVKNFFGNIITTHTNQRGSPLLAAFTFET